MITRSPDTVSTTSPWKSASDKHFDDFVRRLSVKSKAAVEKHVESCEADANLRNGDLWKRIAGGLGTLAPFAIETVGQHAVKYHIPDGKYRQQVFALEDARTGTLVVYIPDILAKAADRKLLTPASPGDAQTYIVGDNSADRIHLEIVTAESKDITHCKAMLGWGRRALRTTLGVNATEKEIRTVERLCELAAEAWADQPVPPVKA
jgi:hypothetical protein